MVKYVIEVAIIWRAKEISSLLNFKSMNSIVIVSLLWTANSNQIQTVHTIRLGDDSQFVEPTEIAMKEKWRFRYRGIEIVMDKTIKFWHKRFSIYSHGKFKTVNHSPMQKCLFPCIRLWLRGQYKMWFLPTEWNKRKIWIFLKPEFIACLLPLSLYLPCK